MLVKTTNLTKHWDSPVHLQRCVDVLMVSKILMVKFDFQVGQLQEWLVYLFVLHYFID